VLGRCKRGRLGLGLKAGQLIGGGVRAGRDHLQRHQPLGLHLPRLVDDAHAALAQHAADLVAGDHRGRPVVPRRPFRRRGGRRAVAAGVGVQTLPQGLQGLQGLDAPPHLRQQLRKAGTQPFRRGALPLLAALRPAQHEFRDPAGHGGGRRSPAGRDRWRGRDAGRAEQAGDGRSRYPAAFPFSQARGGPAPREADWRSPSYRFSAHPLPE